MVQPLRLAIALAPLTLAACAGLPAQQVAVSGPLPPAARYALVGADPADAAGQASLQGAATACLGAAGFSAGQPATLLLQLGHAVRPARAQVLLAGAEPARSGHRPGARRDREELTLALTDPATGAVVWRGTASRVLRKGEQPGDGSQLMAPLCGAADPVRAGRAAASR